MAKRVLLGGIVAAVLFTGCSGPTAPDRGAYDVVKHYSLPCSGRGGFGEYVIVRSHRLTDLEPAFRRWYTTNHHASQCLSLFAFSSSISKAVFEHEKFGGPKAYSAKERATAEPGLFYLNDPNTHRESWIAPGGRPRNGGPGGV